MNKLVKRVSKLGKNQQGGDGEKRKHHVVASGGEEVGPLLLDTGQVVVLQLNDTLGVLLENVLGLLDDVELLFFGQVVTGGQLVVSLVEKSEGVLVSNVKLEEVRAELDNVVVLQAVLLWEEPRGSQDRQSHHSASGEESQVHNVQVCKQEPWLLQRHLADVLDKLDLGRHDGAHELLLVVVVVEQQVLLGWSASGNDRLPHLLQHLAPLVVLLQLSVELSLDGGENVVETLQTLSVDLVVSKGQSELQGDKLVDFVVEGSGLQVDSVGEGANVGLMWDGFFLSQLAHGGRCLKS